MLTLKDFRHAAINLTTNKLEAVCLADVEKYDKDGAKLIYHVGDTKYLRIDSMDEYEEYFFHLGLRKSDNTNVINIHKVVSYDDKLMNVYFDHDKKRSGSVAAIKNKYIKYIVEGLKANKRLEQLDNQYFEKPVENTKDKTVKGWLAKFLI